LALAAVSRRGDVKQVASRKIIAEFFSQHDENMLYRPHLVGKGRKKKIPLTLYRRGSKDISNILK
jgi:hypothetical protein